MLPVEQRVVEARLQAARCDAKRFAYCCQIRSPARIKRRRDANQPGLRAGELSGVGASLKISLAVGMGLLGAFPRPGGRVKTNHVIAGGGSPKCQGPADIAKPKHSQTPPAEPGDGRKDRV